MRGLHKSKRISWASDVNLCQVRLFLSEDSPSLVGLGVQDHLQAKTSWLLHSTGSNSDDILPPGFEVAHPENQLQIKLSQIPVNQWICPPRFVLNVTWQVVAGEESREVEIENQREMRVLEAIYPRASAIPQNPTIAADSEQAEFNDSQTPLIPITPVEDEDGTMDSLSDFASSASVLANSQPSNATSSASNVNSATGMVVGREPDVVCAASAALGALMKSNDPGNLIDRELLVKILNNPKLIEQIVMDVGALTNTRNVNRPIPSPEPQPMHLHRSETSAASVALAGSSPSFSQPNGVGVGPHASSAGVPVSSPSSTGPPVKDLNYYKSLIQQHGEERQDASLQVGNRRSHPPATNQEAALHSNKSRDAKGKITKPCIYFNSPRGCCHGDNCAYQHDPMFQQRNSSMPETPSAKRTKIGREMRN